MATDVDRTVLLLAVYAESGVIKTASKTVTIVAPITTCEITFDANGGTGSKTFASVLLFLRSGLSRIQCILRNTRIKTS